MRGGHSSEPISNVAATKIGMLGEFIHLDTQKFLEYGSWERLFHSVKGRSNLTTHLDCLPHRAAALLHRYAKTGVPVVVQSPPWSSHQKDVAISRGNHPSMHSFEDFVLEEMQDMRKKGIFILLPYQLLRDQPALRISPLGCVPQRERRPHIINDYTFSGINPATIKLAPPEAMQWGRTFHRVLWYIFTADRRHGPVLLSKTDLADGFYQLPLTPTGALKLAVPIQLSEGSHHLAVPTRLPMGWTDGQAQACPVKAMLRRVVHLVQHNAPQDTPLHVYYDHGTKKCVSSAMITSLLRAAALTIPGHAGVDPNNIAARSLRSSGAMALLLGGKDPDKIRILGRWRSDAMFRYLHGHALPLIADNSRIMFRGGHYTLVARTPAAPHPVPP